MEPVAGTIMQIMPAVPGWSVLYAFEDSQDRPWEEPIVAWAVVVIWTTDDTKPEEGEPEPKHRQYQTEIQPYTISQDGQAEVTFMREGLVQLAILQPGQIRIAHEPAPE